MSTKLDPFLSTQNVTVESEELLEPELETQKRRPVIFGKMRARLSEYGNRVLGSARRLIEVTSETITGLGAAIAGSVFFLPLLIIGRAVSVLAGSLVAIIKPLILSIIRTFLDILHAIIWPLHEMVTDFNKHMLFPLIKRIREDDATALVAFVVLVAIVGGIIFLLSNLL